MEFWRASSTFWGKVGNKLLPAALAELASRLQRPQARHTDNNFAKEFRLQNKLWKKLLKNKTCQYVMFWVKIQRMSK